MRISFVVFGLGLVSIAAATPIPLAVPQSVAFGVLGHSCGGIQEQAFATGFDAESGDPIGAVYLQTRCGGSGRGGGYHTTTYSAWLDVRWSFTGAVLASSRLTAPPSGLDPGFSATDAIGNHVYDTLYASNVAPSACAVGNTTYCTYRAYLQLAPGFVPPPLVTGLSIGTGPASGGTTVAIAGIGLTGAIAVTFGDVPATFTVVSDTAITATAPASAAGTVDVTVTTAGGTSVPDTTDLFTFVAAPVVTAVSPTSGSVAGGDDVTITGSDLDVATGVTFGGVPAAFVVNDDGSLTATSPAGEQAEAVHVRVTSLGGTSATGPADRFTYLPLPVPVVAGLTPSDGPVAGGDPVTITGSGFATAFDVSFGGLPAAFSVLDDATIVATSPPGLAAGAVDVIVTTAGGSSGLGAADRFTYTDASNACGGAPCPPSVRCARARGTALALTLSGCAPRSLANRRGALDLATGTVTWQTSDETSVLSLAVTSPGQGECRSGRVEYDLSGFVLDGTSTYTAIGDGVTARLCVNARGKVSLVRHATFDL